MSGESLQVEEKYSIAEPVDVRLPCVFSSNDTLADFADSEVHLSALKNRAHEIVLKVPILENEPSDIEKKTIGEYIVRPRFELNGTALLALYARYGINGEVPPYDNRPFQNL